MKKFAAVLSVITLALVIFAGTASAKVMKFDFVGCSVDVPDGWTVKQYKENYTVGLTAPDKTSAVTISADGEPGMPAKEYAEQLSKELGGGKLEPVDEGYLFHFKNENDVDCFAVVTGDESFIMTVTAIGDLDAASAVIQTMEALE